MKKFQNARQAMPLDSAPHLLVQIRSHKRKMMLLSARNALLRKRGKGLLSELSSLTSNVGKTYEQLTDSCLTTKVILAEIRCNPKKRVRFAPPPAIAPELSPGDAAELIDVLEQATEILRLEFSGTVGSGRETLQKCERVLRKAPTVHTIELQL